MLLWEVFLLNMSCWTVLVHGFCWNWVKGWTFGGGSVRKVGDGEQDLGRKGDGYKITYWQNQSTEAAV